MKHYLILFAFATVGLYTSCAGSKKSNLSSMVARMEVKEPIDGVCDNSNVIAILPIPGNGQVKAVAPKSDEEILRELNEKVIFLKDKPDYEDKGMVNMIVNCKGELVQCYVGNKTQNTELDAQIEIIFSKLRIWTPGKINNRPFDTVVLYSFNIKNGKITFK